MTWTTNSNNKSPFPMFTPNTDFLKPKDIRKDPKYKDVPLIVAPGKEDDYLKDKAQQEAAKQKEAERKSTEREQGTDSSGEAQSVDASADEDQANQLQQANENGWEGLLANFGLDGFGDITHNLGYVLAMLPDMLVGLLTGKTKSLNMDNSMIPLASIVAGMFVKNPILKMLLIGMGGANLINKAGHEALERKANEGSVPDRYAASNRQVAYRQYADEPLNPRLSNPVLKGSCLIVHIDRVPCTIQLPQTVVDAYQAGALPLNTLANTILAKMSRCNLWPCSSMKMVVRSVRQSADQEEYNKNIIKAQYERQKSGRKNGCRETSGITLYGVGQCAISKRILVERIG